MINLGSWTLVDVSPAKINGIYPFSTNGQQRQTVVLTSYRYGQQSLTDPEFVTSDHRMQVGDEVEIYTFASKRYPGRTTTLIDTLHLEPLSKSERDAILKGII